MMHHRRGATTTTTPSNNHRNNGGQLNINRQLGQQQVHINFKSVKQSLLNIFAIITFILFLYGCGDVGFILGIKTEKYVRFVLQSIGRLGFKLTIILLVVLEHHCTIVYETNLI